MTARCVSASLERAREEQRAGRYADAVIAAQEELEDLVETAFTELIGMTVPVATERAVRALVPDRSFMSRGSRLLWNLLTRDDITRPAARWEAYRSHVERRQLLELENASAVGARDAERGLAAVEAVMRHVQAVVHERWEPRETRKPR